MAPCCAEDAVSSSLSPLSISLLRSYSLSVFPWLTPFVLKELTELLSNKHGVTLCLTPSLRPNTVLVRLSCVIPGPSRTFVTCFCTDNILPSSLRSPKTSPSPGVSGESCLSRLPFHLPSRLSGGRRLLWLAEVKTCRELVLASSLSSSPHFRLLGCQQATVKSSFALGCFTPLNQE